MIAFLHLKNNLLILFYVHWCGIFPAFCVKMSEPLELMLQTVVNCHGGARNWFGSSGRAVLWVFFPACLVGFEIQYDKISKQKQNPDWSLFYSVAEDNFKFLILLPLHISLGIIGIYRHWSILLYIAGWTWTLELPDLEIYIYIYATIPVCNCNLIIWAVYWNECFMGLKSHDGWGNLLVSTLVTGRMGCKWNVTSHELTVKAVRCLDGMVAFYADLRYPVTTMCEFDY